MLILPAVVLNRPSFRTITSPIDHQIVFKVKAWPAVVGEMLAIVETVVILDLVLGGFSTFDDAIRVGVNERADPLATIKRLS